MNVLIIGSGGREHALAWKVKQSKSLDKLYVAPGNPGTSYIAENLNINVTDFEQIKTIAKQKNINLIIVGPEVPLVEGITDYFEKENIMVFGPNKNAAQFEGSKNFTKQFLNKYNIPTACSATFSDYNKALEYINKQNKYPIVIKADGLAAGKGVIIVSSYNEAEKTLKSIMQDKIFKHAGNSVVIEEFLQGKEMSMFLLISGNTYKTLPIAQDYKKLQDNDLGPNTGGMGSFAPCKIDKNLMDKIENTAIKPIMTGLKQENINYKGVLFIGFMLVDNNPYVLEFNVRFGDPETQVIMPIIKNDLLDLAIKTIQGKLENTNIETIPDKYCVGITLASSGYPGIYEKGKVIKGLNKYQERLPRSCAARNDNVIVFHAGTKVKDNEVITSGGRVMNVVGLGKNVEQARNVAYEYVNKVHFEGMIYRKDIGKTV